MTRDEAVKVYRAFGLTKAEVTLNKIHPKWFCNLILDETAEDTVDALMALGILKCDPPSPSPQENASE